jgi:hypothetical protein
VDSAIELELTRNEMSTLYLCIRCRSQAVVMDYLKRERWCPVCLVTTAVAPLESERVVQVATWR